MAASSHQHYDYIIIGGGSAGAVLAKLLSDKVKTTCKSRPYYATSVLVLEAGQNLNSDPKVLDPTLSSSQALTYDPKYAYTFVDQETNIISGGRGIGGSSMHNGLQAVHALMQAADEWAEISGDASWSARNLQPLILENEHYTPNDTIPNPDQRGLDGVLFITQSPPLTDKFSAALSVGLEVPLIADFNDNYPMGPGLYANSVGVSAAQAFITPPPNSIRSFAGNSYMAGIPSQGVPPIATPDGRGIGGRRYHMKTNATVTRIIFDYACSRRNRYRAVGVETVRLEGDNQVVKRYYGDNIILSAGAILSPAILQRSGVGPRAVLEDAGVEVLVDSPNVGENSINQYGPNGLVRLLDPTSPPPPATLNTAFTDLRPYYPADTLRRVQCDFLFPGAAFFDQSILATLGVPSSIPAVSVGGIIVSPQSRGRVYIQSPDPFTYPKMELGNYSDSSDPTEIGTDAYTAVSWLKKLPEIAEAQGGSIQDVIYPPPSAYPAPWGPQPDDQALLRCAQTSVFETYHHVATLRMGRSIKDGVVDGKLRVFDVQPGSVIEGLYVCDCSVIPVSSLGNTCLAGAYVPAWKLGRQLRTELVDRLNRDACSCRC